MLRHMLKLAYEAGKVAVKRRLGRDEPAPAPVEPSPVATEVTAPVTAPPTASRWISSNYHVAVLKSTSCPGYDHVAGCGAPKKSGAYYCPKCIAMARSKAGIG